MVQSFIISIILLFFCSCQESNPAQNLPSASSMNTLSYITNSTDNIEKHDNTILKLSDSLFYIVSTNDTLSLSFEKPFSKNYSGVYNGKKINIILNKHIGMESSCYDITAYLQIEGQSEVKTFWLYHTIDSITWFSKDDRSPYQIEYSQPDCYITDNNSRYKLSLNINFPTYDKFEYYLTECEDDKRILYHYTYHCSFISDHSNNLYNKIFNTELFRKCINGKEDITKWKHYLSDSIGEGCYRTYESSIFFPIYMDSTLFVVENLNHSYGGGAHGIYGTTYFNFDVNSGDLIQLENIIDTRKTDFIALLNTKIKEYMDAAHSEEIENDDYFSSFHITSAGIVFVYPGYSLGGGFWEKEIFISFKELEPYLLKQIYPII